MDRTRPSSRTLTSLPVSSFKPSLPPSGRGTGPRAMKRLPSIGVLGSGPVGRGLATLLARADYTVTVGTRHPDAPVLAELPFSVTVSGFDEAARADIVFLAV